MKKSFSNDFATFWLEDGILHFIYHPSVVLNLPTAEKVVADRLKFQGEKAFPVLCDTRGITETEKEARDFLAKNGSSRTSAVAFLVTPLISNTITSFYIRMNKPNTPTKIFTEKFEALKFLKIYLPK